jgi:uncharacterized membrane protein YdjX (TVP38/TMEM64 family)
MILLIIIAVIAVQQRFPFLSSQRNFIEALEQYKDENLFFIGYILAGTVLACFFVPVTWIKAGAAVTLGFSRGLVASLLISNFFAMLSFFIGRKVGKIVVTKWFDKYNNNNNLNYDNFKHKIEQNGLYYVLYLRNIPMLSAAGISYLSSITTISFKDYTIGSFFGMIPGTISVVYMLSSVVYWKENSFNTIIMALLIGLYYVIMHLYAKRHMVVES